MKSKKRKSPGNRPQKIYGIDPARSIEVQKNLWEQAKSSKTCPFTKLLKQRILEEQGFKDESITHLGRFKPPTHFWGNPKTFELWIDEWDAVFPVWMIDLILKHKLEMRGISECINLNLGDNEDESGSDSPRNTNKPEITISDLAPSGLSIFSPSNIFRKRKIPNPAQFGSFIKELESLNIEPLRIYDQPYIKGSPKFIVSELTSIDPQFTDNYKSHESGSPFGNDDRNRIEISLSDELLWSDPSDSGYLDRYVYIIRVSRFSYTASIRHHSYVSDHTR